MIPYDFRICELLETIMAKKPEIEYVLLLSDGVNQFLNQTKIKLDQNRFKFSPEKKSQYIDRTKKYERIQDIFNSILQGDFLVDDLEIGIEYSKEIYNQWNLEFKDEWFSTDKVRRLEILEEILTPHMLVVRFFEKMKNK